MGKGWGGGGRETARFQDGVQERSWDMLLVHGIDGRLADTQSLLRWSCYWEYYESASYPLVIWDLKTIFESPIFPKGEVSSRSCMVARRMHCAKSTATWPCITADEEPPKGEVWGHDRVVQGANAGSDGILPAPQASPHLPLD